MLPAQGRPRSPASYKARFPHSQRVARKVTFAYDIKSEMLVENQKSMTKNELIIVVQGGPDE